MAIINILFLGDIVGELGFQIVAQYVPLLKNNLSLDIVIANAENINNGRGIHPNHYYNLLQSGVDVITLGNHAMAEPIIENYLINKNNIIRPANYQNIPGKGVIEFRLNNNKIFVVLNIVTSMFMRGDIKNPFLTTNQILKDYQLSAENIAGIFMDIHGESAFEKAAIANYVDGKVSAAVGTHTHIPTADTLILPKGTGYQTDAGMCGVYTSCTGIDNDSAISFFMNGSKSNKNWKPKLAVGNPTLCGTFIIIDNNTKLTRHIEPIRIGGILNQNIPNVRK